MDIITLLLVILAIAAVLGWLFKRLSFNTMAGCIAVIIVIILLLRFVPALR